MLGISRDASKAEIKRAYQKLARKYHPDVSQENDAEAHFKEINEAYQVLKDPKARQAYDQLGSGWRQGQEFQPPPGWHFEFSNGGLDPQNMDLRGFSHFFSSMFAGEPLGGSRNHRRELRLRGGDLQTRIKITLNDSFHGAHRKLSLQVQQQNIQGQVHDKTQDIDIHIPKGICEGQQIRLAGLGGAGIGGAPNGDLFLEVSFSLHPHFHAQGRNILMALPITPWEAALGAQLEIPTLAGSVNITIPAGSQSGLKLRLKGIGLPGRHPGDQVVMLRIETPPADSQSARDLYQKMAETLPFNPRAY